MLANKYLSEEPIIFSDKKIAESFVTEGLNLAHSDKSIVGVEIDWLRSLAIENKLSEEWFEDKIENIKNAPATICNT